MGIRVGRWSWDAIIWSPVIGRFHVILSWYCLKVLAKAFAAIISSALERVLKFER